MTLYSELASRFGSTIGLDARATPSVLAALERARDSGQTTMSGQTTLAIDLELPPTERPVAFELFVPVYRHQAPVTTVAQRRAAFPGWASGQFRAMAIAERLRTALPEGTCSIGVAEWARGETADELIGRADQALYAAKDGGRDRCCASPSPPASRRRILESSSGPSGLEAR